ncbi:hypothetical protein RJT34_30890 [Clitoria ternatea]|uniref:PHD-type domain-containing protein n=1 Tax=Clitoria ternatea TaxID=43366 RepID=A0AAN9I2E3_CLITE
MLTIGIWPRFESHIVSHFQNPEKSYLACLAVVLCHLDEFICDMCGDAGRQDLLAICSKCNEGAEHIYCMRVTRGRVPDDWVCEECKERSECQQSESPVNLEPWSNSMLKFKSSCDWKRRQARRCIGSTSQSVKKDRVNRMHAEPPLSFKPCYNTLLPRDFSCKNPNDGNAKATKDTTSELQTFHNPQAKVKVPHDYGHKAVETRATIPEASKPTNQSLLRMESPVKTLGKETLEAACNVCTVKESFDGSQEKPLVPSHVGDELPTLCSKTEIARGKCSLLKSGSSKTAGLKFKGQLVEVQKNEENRDFGSRSALNLNVALEDGDDMVRLHEIDEFDGMDTKSSGDKILLGGDSYNAGGFDLNQPLDEKEKTSESVIDLNLSPGQSVENMDDNPNRDVRGKIPGEENNNADSVEKLDKLPMDEGSNADNGEPSRPPSLSLPPSTIPEENPDVLAAEILISLSRIS